MLCWGTKAGAASTAVAFAGRARELLLCWYVCSLWQAVRRGKDQLSLALSMGACTASRAENSLETW